MKKPKTTLPIGLLVAALVGFASHVPASGTEVRVDAGQLQEEVHPGVFGNSLMFDGNTMGYAWWVTDERGYDEAKAKWNYYLPYVSELGPTVLRYPSGLGANNFHWKPGIGPIAEREQDYLYGYPQVFGTDEFLQYCEELDAEAIMVVNVSTAGKRAGTVQDAADWVEYCNAPNDGSNPGGGTDWAAVRAANGHEEPYNVKYWELGNEEIYPGREDYARRVREYSRAMKGIDPTIRTGVICTGTGLDPVFGTEDWTSHLDFMLENAGDAFDFWIQHTHTPGANGTIVAGFMMVRDGASVTVDFTLERGGDYEIRIPVEGECTLVCPELQLTVDGQDRGLWTAGRLPALLRTASFRMGAGSHTLRLEARLPTNQTRVTVNQQVELVREDDGESVWVDLKNSRELYHALLAGWAAVDRAFDAGEPHRGGKPVFYTETNTAYNVDKSPPFLAKAGSLKEMLNTGCLYNFMIRRGVEVANYWLLFQESQAVGALEGVAYDAEREERGRPDPHRRPVFHLLKAYRENALDRVVATEVLASDTFEAGWRSGVVMGCALESIEMDYVQALGTVSDDGDRLSLFLINLHPEEDVDVPIRLEGFPRRADVRALTITGPSTNATNEPEDCPGGDCVVTRERFVRLPGNPVTYRLPKHSLTVIVFYREGSDQDPPQPPDGLLGFTGDGTARLRWEESVESDLEGYFVYRSRCPEGPFRHRLNDRPVKDSAYVDRAVDPGVEYTYAVRAVDRAGNESLFGDKIVLTPLPGEPDTGPPDGTSDHVPPSPPVLMEVR